MLHPSSKNPVTLNHLTEEDTPDFNQWEPDVLCDLIINTYHEKATGLLSHLSFYTKKIAEVHGVIHPELIRIAEHFSQMKDELVKHLENEEKIVFPAIKALIAIKQSQDGEGILAEIQGLKMEHDLVEESMKQIRQLSSDYRVPPDACSTYSITYQYLQHFGNDLHVHFHLENDILFPKVIKLIKQ